MKAFRRVLLLLAFAGALAHGAGITSAQDAPAGATLKPAVAAPAAPQAKVEPSKQEEHRFWDRKNVWQFAGVGASRALDYASTLNMRRRGVNEVFLSNNVVDNHSAFAAIEAGATGASIGASYLFHRLGHHKLERWTSIVHMGISTGGAVRNYCLETVHHVTPAARP